MSLVKIDNHAEAAVARLPSQFAGKPNMEALVAALTLAVQSWEDVAWDVLVERSVDTAVGVQLDTIGKIVGQDRQGLVDDEYRRAVRAKITVNGSSGLVEQMLTIANLIVDDSAANMVIEPYYPAAFCLAVNDVALTADTLTILAGLLFAAVAGGVGFCLISGSQPASLMFEFAPDTAPLIDADKGFSDDGAPLTGGHFANAVVP